MRRPNEQHHRTSGAALQAWLPVFAAAAIMVTGCLSTFLVLQLDEFRPKVGDIIAYKPGSQDNDTWQMLVTATTVAGSGSAGATCALDPNVMAVQGGSLIVEGRQEEPGLTYRVHWSGGRTDNAADCGAQADLVVSRTDLQRLANAAGGFGIGAKGIHD